MHDHHETMTYTCPMHPDIHQDHPGMCPECGMNLVPEKPKKHHQHTDHNKHAGHSTNEFQKKFWVALVLSVPVIFFPNLIVKAVLGSIVFFYCGWVFLASAWREIRARLPGMMTLIAIAITTAYSYSIVQTLRGMTDVLYWELSTLITIMLLGHWLEMRAVSGAQSALKELSKLLPDTAEVLHNGTPHTVALSELHEGDFLLVRPGAKIPADGVVTEGRSEVDESLATGESRPVLKKEGDGVIAGTINGDGALTMRVTAIGEHTFLAGVMRLVAQAQASKSRLQILSDRAALWLTVIAVLSGSLTLAAWLATGAGLSFAMQRFVAVLVIACPHALGLAVPLVASISTTKAARNGFLVKQRLALEAARNVDTVLFDKTGTLTTGVFSVISVSSDETLQLAASVDARSEHPIAKAIVAQAHQRGLTILPMSDYQRLPGVGGQATIEGATIFVGHRQDQDIVVERNGQRVGTISVGDTVRSESRQAVATLKQMGVRVAMITGDAQEVADRVAKELGIDEYFSRVLPDQKVEKVKMLQGRGQRVVMVGDGINDAPALTQADVGIAIGAGTNVAIESAGIILVRNDPRDIAKVIRLSRLTYAKMIQNLWWAAGYNIIAIPLAAGVLARWGVVLQPAVSAFLMSASTVIVAFNAVLLRRRVL